MAMKLPQSWWLLLALACAWLFSIDSAAAGSVASTATGAGRGVTIATDFKSIELLPYISGARDPHNDWPLTKAAREHFEPLEKGRLGYTTDAVWVRFSIENVDSVDRSLVLDLGEKHFQQVRFFVTTHGGDQPLAQAVEGWARPYVERQLKARNVVFPLKVPAGQTIDVYASVRTPVQMLIDPLLYDEYEFLQRLRGENIVTFGFYGALAALLIYNLLLALATREPASLSYTVFLLSWGVLIACWDGLVYQFWPYELLHYSIRTLYVAAALGIVTMTVFSVEYLQLRSRRPRYMLPQYTLLALGIVFVPVALLADLLTLKYIVSLLYLLLLLNNGATSCLLSFRGQREARFYMAGFVAMLVSVLFAMYEVFFVEGRYNSAEIWGRLAFLLPVGLLTVGLGYRINELKTQAAESAARAHAARAEAEFKSRFLVTMSHEIRTPLNGVVGMTELLQEAPLGDTQKRYVDVIGSSAKALLEVINDVLDFAKLEHGKFSLEIIDFNLERLVDECINVFALTKKSGAVTFNACIEPGTPLLLRGDPTRIKQVLINLVGNAFKFTQHGEVNLNVRLAPAERPGLAPMLKFMVADTGIGMDAQVQGQVFAAFTQADGSITRRYGGSGLGLAICKQLVELMGGNIGVHSEPRHGSRFWFTLPLVVATEDAIVEPLPRAPLLRGKRVLLVDDHDAFCHTMRVALESFGMTVDIAQTGRHARDRGGIEYAVLVIDRQLPDGDGLDLALDLRRHSNGSAPPVILVSAGVDILDETRLRDVGVAAHLLKPIPLATLHAALVRLFEQAPATPQKKGEGELRPWKVLVADDNTTNQLVIGSMLKRFGIAATFASDGQLAVDRWRQALEAGQGFDIVFMDCEMPVLDGYGATQAIREFERLRGDATNTHIIGLTAHALPEYREKALAAGMADFITKPVKLAELRQALERFEREMPEAGA